MSNTNRAPDRVGRGGAAVAAVGRASTGNSRPSGNGAPILLQVTSAIPGRIRVRLKASSADTSLLKQCARRIAAVAGVSDVQVIGEAYSLVVRYSANGRSPESYAREILAAAVSSGQTTAGGANAASEPPGASQSSSPGIRPTTAAKAVTALNRVSSPALLAVAPAPAGDTDSNCDKTLSLGCTVGRVVARTPARVPHIKVREYSYDKPRAQQLMIATAVVGLTLIEAIPIGVMWVAIAIAALPIARRATHNNKRKVLTPDTLDCFNIAIVVVLDAAFFQAALMAWLIAVAELIRGETLRRSHVEMHDAAHNTLERVGQRHDTQKTVEKMLDSVITDSEFQHIWTKSHNSTSWPLIWIAGTAFALTRDPGYIIGILKPRADFASALCFGVPLPLINAMSRSANHGPLLRNTHAIEKLAHVDAVVFLTVGTITDEHHLGRRIIPLMERGIHRFILPTEVEAGHVRRAAERHGFPGVVAEALPEERHGVIEKLVRHGHKVAVIDDGKHDPLDLNHADVHVVLDTSPIPEKAHMVLTHADLHGLVQAIDASREATKLMRHNTRLAAGAAVLNLGLSLVPPVYATAVNTVTVAALSYNSLRVHTNAEKPHPELGHTVLLPNGHETAAALNAPALEPELLVGVQPAPHANGRKAAGRKKKE